MILVTIIFYFQVILFSFTDGLVEKVPVPPRNYTKPPAVARIIGGQGASSHQFPWQASVMSCKDNNQCSVCGGSLISPVGFILTAAHCTFNQQQFDIGLGSTELFSPAIKLSSTVKFEHPKYNPNTLDNDISLVKLPQAVKLSNSVQVIKLADSSLGSFVRRDALISGFGKTSENSSISTSLNFISMKIISNMECAQYYGPFVLSNKLVCAKGKQNASVFVCSGDSGSPLVVKRGNTNEFIQIGVTSFVPKAGCSTGPSGYTRVSTYRSWISQVIKKNQRKRNFSM